MLVADTRDETSPLASVGCRGYENAALGLKILAVVGAVFLDSGVLDVSKPRGLPVPVGLRNNQQVTLSTELYCTVLYWTVLNRPM